MSSYCASASETKSRDRRVDVEALPGQRRRGAARPVVDHDRHDRRSRRRRRRRPPPGRPRARRCGTRPARARRGCRPAPAGPAGPRRRAWRQAIRISPSGDGCAVGRAAAPTGARRPVGAASARAGAGAPTAAALSTSSNAARAGQPGRRPRRRAVRSAVESQRSAYEPTARAPHPARRRSAPRVDRRGGRRRSRFPATPRRRRVAEVAAEPGLVVETVDGRFCGAVVATGQGARRRRAARHGHPRGPARPAPGLPDAGRRRSPLDGVTVTLVPPAPAPRRDRRPAAAPRRARSRSPAAPAQVARASRIWVEGIHDAALVERIWGDDLRVEGVVVEPMDGIDDLPELRRASSARRRSGGSACWSTTWCRAARRSRIAAGVRDPNVLITGHPYVDIWQAVKPTALGIAAWPQVPRGVNWKDGICAALGVSRPARDVAPGAGRRRQLRRRRAAAAAGGRGTHRLRDRAETRPSDRSCNHGAVPAWLIWLIAAGGLAAAETLSLDFVLIMCAGGAAAGAVAAARRRARRRCRSWSRSWPRRCCCCSCVRSPSGTCCRADPPQRHRRRWSASRRSTSTEVGPHSGLVRLNGADWSARSIGEGHVYPPGTTRAGARDLGRDRGRLRRTGHESQK